jgi:hypothetical protein
MRAALVIAVLLGLAGAAYAVYRLRQRGATYASAPSGATAPGSEPVVRVRIIAWGANPAYIPPERLDPYTRSAFAAVPATTPRPVGARDYRLSQIPYPTRIEDGRVISSRTGRGGTYEGPPVREVRDGVERWAVWQSGGGSSTADILAIAVVVGSAVATGVGGPGAGAAVAAGGSALVAATA